METPEQTAHRLLAALEELVTQESIAVHASDFPLIEFIQQRAGAIVTKLIDLAQDPAVAGMRRQVELLMDQRWQNGLVLRQRLSDVSAEITRLQGARQRLTRVAPAYSKGRSSLPSFTAAA